MVTPGGEAAFVRLMVLNSLRLKVHYACIDASMKAAHGCQLKAPRLLLHQLSVPCLRMAKSYLCGLLLNVR